MYKYYYLLEIIEDQPYLWGPYTDAEAQKRDARRLRALGRQVFWLDVEGAVSAGRVTKEDGSAELA